MRTWLSWSSGKDSAWALAALRKDPEVELVGLLTTLNGSAERVAMHAVRRELLERQARSAGLPLIQVELPWPCSNEDYQERMAAACARAESEGVEAIAFGDLFLEDVRAYREEQLAPTRLRPLFPLWGLETGALAREMIDAGLRATLTCIDEAKLDASFAGAAYDHALLERLPEGVDPCGEKGEFHSFAWDGPMFAEPIPVELGELRSDAGFCYRDLKPL